MEKGMKAQLKVGDGDGDLPSIPGVTALANPDDYSAGPTEMFAAAKVTEAQVAAANEALAKAEADAKAGKKPTPPQTDSIVSGTTVIGLALGLILSAVMSRKFEGKSAAEATAYCFDILRVVLGLIKKLIMRLFNLIISSKNKMLPSK